MTPLSPYPESSAEERKKKNCLEGYTTRALLHKGQAAREHVVALVSCITLTKTIEFSFFLALFLPTQSRVYETVLLEPQTNQRACFSSSSNTCTLMWHDKILVASAQSHARRHPHKHLTFTRAHTCMHTWTRLSHRLLITTEKQHIVHCSTSTD